MLMNTRDQYGLIARLLHWFIAALAIGMIVGGSLLSILPSGGFKAVVIAGHKSIGVVIFLLMIGRIAWRLTNPHPRDLGKIPILNYIARLVHIFFVCVAAPPTAGGHPHVPGLWLSSLRFRDFQTAPVGLAKPIAGKFLTGGSRRDGRPAYGLHRYPCRGSVETPLCRS